MAGSRGFCSDHVPWFISHPASEEELQRGTFGAAPRADLVSRSEKNGGKLYKFLAISWEGNLQLRTPRVYAYGPGLTNLSTSACCHVQLAATLGDESMSGTGGNP